MNALRGLVHHFVPSHENAYRPHLLGKQWLIFFLTIVFTSEAVFIAGIMARQEPTANVGAVVAGEVIALTNTKRAESDLGSLSEQPQLDLAAQAKADDMAQKGYFSHVSPDGTEPWAWILNEGYAYQSAGENLAVRFDTSNEVVNAWMASPSHRANIVKPVYTQIGVATAEGTYQGSRATFVVQYFASPRAQAAIIPSKAEEQIPPTKVAVKEISESPPEVAGSETSVVAAVPISQSSQYSESVIRQALRALAETPQSTLYILGGVLSLLVLLLALTFFIHMEIQPKEMLMSGAVVAIVALVFLALNTNVPFSNSRQSASVFEATPHGLIGGGGAMIEKALELQ